LDISLVSPSSVKKTKSPSTLYTAACHREQTTDVQCKPVTTVYHLKVS